MEMPLQGMQAAALKPADYSGNDAILYLMEDMATGEIRLSIPQSDKSYES